MVLASLSLVDMPTNSLASSYDKALDDALVEATKEESKETDPVEELEYLLGSYKNESQVRKDDGTDKFNRGTETNRETFGQDKNVNNIEKAVQEKLEETKGEYGKKDGAYAGNNLKVNQEHIKNIVVNQGANETQIAITWFGKGNLQESKVVFDGKTYKAQGSNTGDNLGYYSYRAIIDGITPGKSYSYYVQTGSNKSKTYTLKAKGFGKDNSFSVAWFGDPQIESGDKVWDSKGLEKHSQGKVDQDKADFTKIVEKARAEDPNFFISMGDNVEVVSYEGEYDAFLDNDLFREKIFTSVVGNHETYIDENDEV